MNLLHFLKFNLIKLKKSEPLIHLQDALSCMQKSKIHFSTKKKGNMNYINTQYHQIRVAHMHTQSPSLSYITQLMPANLHGVQLFA